MLYARPPKSPKMGDFEIGGIVSANENQLI
jgi:hypothetical protein